jgi:uncharacterized protein YbaA (DUF1428 family)
MSYVDGFVIPVPEQNLDAYIALAEKAEAVWRDHGALGYFECVGDDMGAEFCMSFPAGISANPGEVVIFSFIIYKSRAHRDEVNAKVMADPRISGMVNEQNMPFDVKRMIYGGFRAVVENPGA